jgi:hypothetical protein
MNQRAVHSKFPPAFRPGDLVAVCPDNPDVVGASVGPSGANISRFAKYSG